MRGWSNFIIYSLLPQWCLIFSIIFFDRNILLWRSFLSYYFPFRLLIFFGKYFLNLSFSLFCILFHLIVFVMMILELLNIKSFWFLSRFFGSCLFFFVFLFIVIILDIRTFFFDNNFHILLMGISDATIFKYEFRRDKFFLITIF